MLKPARIHRARILVLALILAPFAVPTASTRAEVASPFVGVQNTLWVTNGRVRATQVVSNTLYIGGDFTYVGPPTGSGAALSTSTGAPDLSLPRINGLVQAVQPDGTGGWYVGGQFTRVGGVPRNNAAHIRSDGTVDPLWNPNPSGPNTLATYGVRTLALSGTTVYLGGTFMTVGGQPRANIAAVDAATAAVAPWNPGADNPVFTLAITGTTLYVGGQFSTIAGGPRNAIAAFDLTTHTLTAWNPAPAAGDFVDAIAVSGQTVYVGGGFALIGGQNRANAAALDATTGQAAAWNPAPDGYINALVIYGQAVYLGGIFSTVSGVARPGAAAVDAVTGAPTPFNADARLQNVAAYTLRGATLYAGGTVEPAGAHAPYRLIVGFAAATGAPTGYVVLMSDLVQALAGAGATLYAGGFFTSAGGVGRSYVAALDLTTGRATSWHPLLNGSVLGLAAAGPALYVVGGFLAIGGATRPYIGAIDLDTGQATPFTPPGSISTPASAYTIAVADNTVYVGGSFTQIGSVVRVGLLALDATSGALTTWNPRVGQPGSFPTFCVVCAIAIRSSTLYAGGSFPNVGRAPRQNLAAISRVTGLATPWNPDVQDPNGGVTGVSTLAFGGASLYIGGVFTTVGGQPRGSLAEVDLTTGQPTPWNPCGNCRIAAVAVDGSAVYAGGDQVTPLGSTDYTHTLEAFDLATGALLLWNPQPIGLVSNAAFGNEVDTLTPARGELFVGGAFMDIAQNGGRSGIAGLSLAR